MQNIRLKSSKTAAIFAIAFSGAINITAKAATPVPDTLALGQQLAFDTMKGNCLACHKIAGGESPGDIGPPLVGVKKRYPSMDKLRAQIFDATVANPETSMPPFGRNRILTDQELDAITAFIWSK